MKTKFERRLFGALYLIIFLVGAILWARELMAEGVAFFTHESPPSGFYKICYYNYLGSEIAITVRTTDLCPLTIKVP